MQIHNKPHLCVKNKRSLGSPTDCEAYCILFKSLFTFCIWSVLIHLSHNVVTVDVELEMQLIPLQQISYETYSTGLLLIHSTVQHAVTLKWLPIVFVHLIQSQCIVMAMEKYGMATARLKIICISSHSHEIHSILLLYLIYGLIQNFFMGITCFFKCKENKRSWCYSL
jgi:hypothetical protein